MDYQLLYTYTNYDGDVISVEGDFITAYCGDTGNQLVAVLTPVGDKGVALARAILTSAGNTGHFVTSVETVVDSSRVSVEYGARSMRERIADAMEVEYGLLAARMVETMPLLPGDTDDDGTPVYETPQELAQEIERLTNERDRLRAAWKSARHGRAQTREQLEDARRYVRILEAQRADLRQEVRDTSDQALRATRALPALTERVTQIEKHLDITPESA